MQDCAFLTTTLAITEKTVTTMAVHRERVTKAVSSMANSCGAIAGGSSTDVDA